MREAREQMKTTAAPRRTGRAGGSGPARAGRVTRARAWINGPLADRLSVGHRRIPPRRIVRWIAVGVAVAVPSLALGVATATADANLGPHAARYDVTLDHEITVDVGPLGTLVIDSPLPLMLGARVVVQEIPSEITAVEATGTLEELGEDLDRYVQFFAAPEATITVVARALVIDALRRALFAAVLTVLVILGLRAALGPQRRGELAAGMRPHAGLLVGGGSVVVMVLATLTASVPLGADSSRERVASSVFDDTPLEGARITGRLAGIIDTYGGYAVDAYWDNQRFYDDATSAVREAWARQEALQAEIARLRSADPSLPATEEPEDGATEPVVMLVVSDLHCNVGMVPVIREVAELAGADIVLNAGDSTVNGTSVESYCVTAFAGAVPDGAVQVVADGNHDSPETANQERSVGAHVLDGQVIEVAGVRILGDADPRATRIGTGTVQRGEESVADISRRLADVACEDPDGVDLLLVHDPLMGNASLEEGCVPAQVSGHMHRRLGPVWHGNGTRYVSSSTAGARLGQPTVGPLNGVAELTVLRFDPDSRRIVDYRLVRVHPDTDASVGAWLDWPGEPLAPTPRNGRL